MKVAVCFYGEMGFMDRFMIQNLIRCLLAPLQKYTQNGITFYYFLHTYFHPDVLSWIEMMRASFPFTSITLHDRDMVLRDKQQEEDAIGQNLLLQHHSLHRVKKKWKVVEDLDIVVLTRLDLLFTKALSENDIGLILHHKRHLFVHEDNKPFVAIGDPMVMNLFTDHIDHDDHLFLDMIRAQHNIKIQYISLVFVRILPDAVVHPEDYHICPYLGDLIASSATQIHLSKRKNSLRKS
jgi:hypothetical protein